VAKKSYGNYSARSDHGREPKSWEGPRFFEAFPKFPVYIFCKGLFSAHTFV
jgi:hypothetical protein